MRVSFRSLASTSLLASCVLLSFGSQVGCKSLAKKAAEKAIEERTGAKSVDLGSSGSVEVNDGKGTRVAAGQSVKLPDDWPSFVPAYPSAAIQVAAHNASTHEYSAVMLSGDAPEQILAFYKPKVIAAGFKVEGHLNAGSMQSDTYKHKDGRQVVIMLTDSDGKHSILISVKGA